MDRNALLILAAIVAVGVALVAMSMQHPEPQAPEPEPEPGNAEAEARSMAEAFVRSSPTYSFDGMELRHKETLADVAGCENCWTFVFEFQSRQAGYGDRTGQMLAQVITPHTARVRVENGKITSAVLDGRWDMREQEMLETDKPFTFVQLIEFHAMQGIRNWVHELDSMGLSALLNVQESILEENAEEFRILAERGYEVAGGYHAEPFWDVNYTFQYEKMKAAKDMVENITGKPMRVFGSRYFAYDETTLKVADELGIDYILARGTDDVEAVIYEPEEYDAKIISVSNVEFETMGRGSLCDYSLWARGATGEDFEEKLYYALNKSPERLMVVSHAYLGGMKDSWWQVYKDLLDSDDVEWASDFDEWVDPANGINRRMPFDEIPVNREVQYVEPKPAEPLEGLENVSQMHNPCAVPGVGEGGQPAEGANESKLMVFHNNEGPMCIDMLDWLEDVESSHPDLAVEEHLTYEPGETELMQSLIAQHGGSMGESASFEYYPIIFFEGRAFSGFNRQVEDELDSLIEDR